MKDTCVKFISLLPQELVEVEHLLDDIFCGNLAVNSDKFLLEACVLAHRLPERIRRFLYDFKLKESSIGVCIKNYPIDEMRLGKTPSMYPSKESVFSFTREEVLHILFASLLGEVMEWSTQQNGSIINEIIPIQGNENKIINSNSHLALDLHCDDAFHPYMEDYLGWVCLRNPDKVPTIISSLDGDELDPDLKGILFEPRFPIGASSSQEVKLGLEKVPILFGHRDHPYMRFNIFNVMDALEDDKEAKYALNALMNILLKNIQEIIFEPGDYCYLDNLRAVHGRRPYIPKYDRNDRWLKRLLITDSLRKSRALRDYPASRVIKGDFYNH